MGWNTTKTVPMNALRERYRIERGGGSDTAGDTIRFIIAAPYPWARLNLDASQALEQNLSNPAAWSRVITAFYWEGEGVPSGAPGAPGVPEGAVGIGLMLVLAIPFLIGLFRRSDD